MKVIIDGRNLILNTLIDTGAGMNAIKPEFVPYHVRQTSRIQSVRTITGTEEISSEAPIVLCLNKAGTENMQVSYILHNGLAADLFLGTPFISAVKPCSFEDHQEKNCFIFSVKGKKICLSYHWYSKE